MNDEYQIDLNNENSILELQQILNQFQNSILNIQSGTDIGDNRYILELEIVVENNINENNINENIPNYFKNIKEINNNLGKPIYIKKHDDILDKSCFICLEKYEYKKYKRILRCCKNTCHKKCIDKWLKKNSTCPTCRHDYLKEENEEQNN